MTQMDLKKQNVTPKELERNKEYARQVKKRTPVKSLLPQMLKAFFTGGLICLLGQIIMNICMKQFQISKEDAGAWCSLLLVLISVILTGMRWYAKIVDFGGAGALVPITGFANSVSSAAIEYQKEGQVYGIGSKIFSIAGPVILYGIFSSFILGLLYWGGKCLGLLS